MSINKQYTSNDNIYKISVFSSHVNVVGNAPGEIPHMKSMIGWLAKSATTVWMRRMMALYFPRWDGAAWSAIICVRTTTLSDRVVGWYAIITLDCIRRCHPSTRLFGIKLICNCNTNKYSENAKACKALVSMYINEFKGYQKCILFALS